jgi:hypothetical protein
MHKNSLQAAQREQTGKLSCRINNIDKSPNILNDADHQIICIYSKLFDTVHVLTTSYLHQFLPQVVMTYYMPQSYGINAPVYASMSDKSKVELSY